MATRAPSAGPLSTRYVPLSRNHITWIPILVICVSAFAPPPHALSLQTKAKLLSFSVFPALSIEAGSWLGAPHMLNGNYLTGNKGNKIQHHIILAFVFNTSLIILSLTLYCYIIIMSDMLL